MPDGKETPQVVAEFLVTPAFLRRRRSAVWQHAYLQTYVAFRTAVVVGAVALIATGAIVTQALPFWIVAVGVVVVAVVVVAPGLRALRLLQPHLNSGDALIALRTRAQLVVMRGDQVIAQVAMANVAIGSMPVDFLVMRWGSGSSQLQAWPVEWIATERTAKPPQFDD